MTMIKSLHFVFINDPTNYGLMLSYLKSLGVTIDSSKGIKARNFLIQAETAQLLHQHGLISDSSLENQYREEAQKAIAEFEDVKRKFEEFYQQEMRQELPRSR